MIFHSIRFIEHIYVVFIVRTIIFTVLELRANFVPFLFSKDFDQSKNNFRGFFFLIHGLADFQKNSYIMNN